MSNPYNIFQADCNRHWANVQSNSMLTLRRRLQNQSGNLVTSLDLLLALKLPPRWMVWFRTKAFRRYTWRWREVDVWIQEVLLRGVYSGGIVGSVSQVCDGWIHKTAYRRGAVGCLRKNLMLGGIRTPR